MGETASRVVSAQGESVNVQHSEADDGPRGVTHRDRGDGWGGGVALLRLGPLGGAGVDQTLGGVLRLRKAPAQVGDRRRRGRARGGDGEPAAVPRQRALGPVHRPKRGRSRRHDRVLADRHLLHPPDRLQRMGTERYDPGGQRGAEPERAARERLQRQGGDDPVRHEPVRRHPHHSVGHDPRDRGDRRRRSLRDHPPAQHDRPLDRGPRGGRHARRHP